MNFVNWCRTTLYFIIKLRKTLKALLLRQLIGCKWQSRTNKLLNNLCQLVDCIFSWIAEIDGTRVVAVHQCNQSGDQITDVLEWPCLISTAINLPSHEQNSLTLINSVIKQYDFTSTAIQIYIQSIFAKHMANNYRDYQTTIDVLGDGQHCLTLSVTVHRTCNFSRWTWANQLIFLLHFFQISASFCDTRKLFVPSLIPC